MGTNKCNSCKYQEEITCGQYGCLYILYAKKRRGCPPENCDKYKKRGKKDPVQLSLHLALGERGLLD